MIRISFTKFLDFVASTGEPKAVSALSAWRQSNTPYDPMRDFHKRIREAFISMERTHSVPDWDSFIENQSIKKRTNFRDSIEKYDLWRNEFENVQWFDPPREEWSGGGFTVNVNPELGLKLDGVAYAIKLYFNLKKLSTLKAQAGGMLMHKALNEKIPNCHFAIFDVKAETFHVYDKASEAMNYLLIGEAAHLSAILNAVNGENTMAAE